MGTTYLNLTPSQIRIGWIDIGVIGTAMTTCIFSICYTAIYDRTPS